MLQAMEARLSEIAGQSGQALALERSGNFAAGEASFSKEALEWVVLGLGTIRGAGLSSSSC
jgi:hypothetical protein